MKYLSASWILVLFQSSSVVNSCEVMAFENVNVSSCVIVKYDASFYLCTVLDIVSEKKAH